MKPSKIRRQIAWTAARLMYDRQENEYYGAKMKAARQVCQGWVKPADLPNNAEIRDEVQKMARMFEGSSRDDSLLQMRIDALRVMRLLEKFRPRLIGSVLTGHTRAGSDIDLHVFTDNLGAVTAQLDYVGICYEVERKNVRKNNERRIYRHIHVKDLYPTEITVYPAKMTSHVFTSSITGKPIERASLQELESMMREWYPDIDLDQQISAAGDRIDRFDLYYSLLLPLENIKQDPRYHPEGDALYHSLQVYDLTVDRRPYDEELVTAALLHDVGKAIEPLAHIDAALDALTGFITDRIHWLIQHHMEAHKVIDGSIGARAKRRLAQHEDFEDLMLLAECDRQGRAMGIETTSLEDAISELREMSIQFG